MTRHFALALCCGAWLGASSFIAAAQAPAHATAPGAAPAVVLDAAPDGALPEQALNPPPGTVIRLLAPQTPALQPKVGPRRSDDLVVPYTGGPIPAAALNQPPGKAVLLQWLAPAGVAPGSALVGAGRAPGPGELVLRAPPGAPPDVGPSPPLGKTIWLVVDPAAAPVAPAAAPPGHPEIVVRGTAGAEAVRHAPPGTVIRLLAPESPPAVTGRPPN